VFPARSSSPCRSKCLSCCREMVGYYTPTSIGSVAKMANYNVKRRNAVSYLDIPTSRVYRLSRIWTNKGDFGGTQPTWISWVIGVPLTLGTILLPLASPIRQHQQKIQYSIRAYLVRLGEPHYLHLLVGTWLNNLPSLNSSLVPYPWGVWSLFVGALVDLVG